VKVIALSLARVLQETADLVLHRVWQAMDEDRFAQTR